MLDYDASYNYCPFFFFLKKAVLLPCIASHDHSESRTPKIHQNIASLDYLKGTHTVLCSLVGLLIR